jgi:hypothetical protein
LSLNFSALQLGDELALLLDLEVSDLPGDLLALLPGHVLTNLTRHLSTNNSKSYLEYSMTHWRGEMAPFLEP